MIYPPKPSNNAANPYAKPADRSPEDLPLDTTAAFTELCDACRAGDLKRCQELVSDGVNFNARDAFDYTPLILVGEQAANINVCSLANCTASRPAYAASSRL